MKRTSIALFVASLGLFLLSIANLTPGPIAADAAKIVEVSGTVDVGNLPLDENGRVLITSKGENPPQQEIHFVAPISVLTSTTREIELPEGFSKIAFRLLPVDDPGGNYSYTVSFTSDLLVQRTDTGSATAFCLTRLDQSNCVGTFTRIPGSDGVLFHVTGPKILFHLENSSAFDQSARMQLHMYLWN